MTVGHVCDILHSSNSPSASHAKKFTEGSPKSIIIRDNKSRLTLFSPAAATFLSTLNLFPRSPDGLHHTSRLGGALLCCNTFPSSTRLSRQNRMLLKQQLVLILFRFVLVFTMTASTDAGASADATAVIGPTSITKPVIKAILFDMDGTLLDTETLSDKALLLALFGGVVPPHILAQPPMSDYSIPWELKKQLLGLRGAEWAPIAIRYAEQYWQPEQKSLMIEFPDAMQLWKAWEDHLSVLCEEVDACAGAKELVQALAAVSSKQSLLPMAIATSSRYAGVDKKRKRHEQGMFEHIQAIVAGDDVAVTNGKPAPDIYLEAAKRLGIKPEDCLVFEDALSGVKAGKAAGCRVVAIPDPRYTEEERAVFESQGGADVILNSLWEFDGRPFGLDVDMRSLKKDKQ